MASILTAKYDVTVIAPIIEQPGSALTENLDSYEIRRVPIPQYFSNRLKSNRVLHRLFFMICFSISMLKIWHDVSKTRVKLIQGEQQLSLLPALILSLLLRAPLILDDAIALDKSQEYYRKKGVTFFASILEMFLLHSCRLIISSSTSAGKSLSENFKISPLKIKIVQNGVESAKVFNKNFKSNQTTKDVLFVS